MMAFIHLIINACTKQYINSNYIIQCVYDLRYLLPLITHPNHNQKGTKTILILSIMKVQINGMVIIGCIEDD